MTRPLVSLFFLLLLPTLIQSTNNTTTYYNPHPIFQTLTCNTNIDWETQCSPSHTTLLSTLLPATSILVPCGSCITVDITDGSTVDLPDGVHIMGKLYFPKSANVVIKTTFVVVEGVLGTEQPALGETVLGSGSNKVTIFLYEEKNRRRTRHLGEKEKEEEGEERILRFRAWEEDNIMGIKSDEQRAMAIGRKGISVIGGKLDIRAMDDSCPAWEHLLDYTITPINGDENERTLSEKSGPTPGPKPTPPEGCTRTIFSVNYRVGDNVTRVFGGSATIEPMNPDSTDDDDDATKDDDYNDGEIGNAYLSHTRGSWIHGPIFHIPNTECIVPNTSYLVEGSARLVSTNGTPPKCSADGSGNDIHCFEMKVLNRSGNPYLGRMSFAQRKYIPNDGSFFTFTISLKGMSEDLIDGRPLDLWFWRPEENVRIDIDRLSIYLPSDDSFPDDTESGCSELAFGNSGADENGRHTWPWKSSNDANYMTVEEEVGEDGLPNRFFRLRRAASDWGMWYKGSSYKTPCVVADVEYDLSLRYRIFSDDPIQVYWRFGWKSNTGVWKYERLSCPKSSKTIGWIECKKRFATTAEMAAAVSYQLWSHSPSDSGPPYSTVDFDDVTLKRYDPNAEVRELYVSQAAARCWQTGSRLLVTSSTERQDDAWVVEVIDSDPEKGTVMIDRELPFTTTKKDDDRFPVEVANLSRNFVITAEDDPDDELKGGHTMVKKTIGVVQTIQGAAFVNLGRQGTLGRYPIHLHMCDDVEGSLISKNVVENSNQRGVVIHGTDNVTISENILFNVRGHGYFLEDGAEQYNRFYRNLATGIRKVVTLVPSGGVETDKDPSAFWISNTMNYFEGNVIAGSCCHGYWVEPQRGKIRGPSAGLEKTQGMDRTKLNLLHFVDNDVHGTTFATRLYPNFWNPPDEARIVNLRAYRNSIGISLHVDTNVRLVGGYYGDNNRQIWSNLADDITVDGAEIVGASQKFKEAMARANRIPRCASGGRLLGVSFSTHRQFSQSSTGITLKNVSFRDFDCGSKTFAILAGDEQARNGNEGLYEASTKLAGGITFQNVPTTMSGCDVMNQGVSSLAFEDIDGSLNPANNGVPGFIVSDDPLTKSIVGNACTLLSEKACLLYCENLCLQTLVIGVSTTWKAEEMILTDKTGKTFTVPHRGTSTYSKTHFGVSLPGGTYTLAFLTSNGTPLDEITDDNVKVVYEGTPTCAKRPTIVLRSPLPTMSPYPTVTSPTAAPTTPPTGGTDTTPVPSSAPTTAPTPTPCQPKKCRKKSRGCNIYSCVKDKCVKRIDMSKCASKSCKIPSKCLKNGKCKYKNDKKCCAKKNKPCSKKKKCCSGLVCKKKRGKKKCVKG